LKFRYEDLVAEVIEKLPHIKHEEVMVRQTVTEGMELILEAERVPQFGHVIIVG
jgi:hypothetical protein